MAVAPATYTPTEYQYGFHDDISYLEETKPGLTREVVEEISAIKGEPEWMLKFRLRAYEHYLKRPMPQWGGDLNQIDLNKIVFYRKPSSGEKRSWDDVPDKIKTTFERLGIPEAERKFLAGVGAQWDSEVVYHNVREELSKLGVVFMGTDQALKEYPELFRKYFGTVVPPEDNKFAALNSACWSGGCLTAGAMLFTERGRVSIADIREGDMVFAATPEGEVRLARVQAQVNSGTKQVFRLKVAGQEIESTANHRFLTLRKSTVRLNGHGLLWPQEWLSLSELAEGDLIAMAKRLPEYGSSRALPALNSYARNSHRFAQWRVPAQTSPDLMWLLGLWTGDGSTYWVGDHQCRINFALPKNQKGEVRAEAIRLLTDLFGYKERPGTQTKTSFNLNSKAIGQWMAEIGFVGKATTKRIPGWIYALPLSERFAFLGGLLDSDGWIENQGRTVSFELANRGLISDIKALAVSCGLYTNGEIVSRQRQPVLFTKEGRYINAQASHRCRLQGDLAQIATRTASKRERLATAKRTVFDKYRASHGRGFFSQTDGDVGFAPIRSIEEIGEVETFDIQVEGLENFVANGIVAHNSFVYVPKGVEVPLPLQAYFRINAENTGQFERTLIIVEEGAKVSYVEGCLGKETLVRTTTGLRRIDEIAPGELVLTHGGRWRQVENVNHRPYTGHLVSLRAFGQPWPLEATAEHPLLVLPAEHDPQKPLLGQQTIRMAEKVKPGDFLVLPIPKVADRPMEKLIRHFEFGPASRKTGKRKEVEVRVPLNPGFYRLLGYYLSEGHADKEHCLSVSFHAKEQAYLADAETLLETFSGKATSRNKVANNGQTIVLCDTRLTRLFAREFGSTYRSKHVPPWIAATSRANLEALVLGMWRGDGSFDQPTEMFRYNSATPELAEAFRDALFRLGLTALISCQRKRGGNRRPMYQVIIAKEDNAAFAKLVGVPFQSRESQRVDGYHNRLRDEDYLYLRVRETSLREVEAQEVWNLSVEDDETYVAGGVASHNCTAPIYTTDALHAAVVEVIALAGSKVRYTTIQNWSNDVYNLVTKRAHAYAHSTVEWVDANTGCLTGDTAVYTTEGLRPIASLRVGDRVHSLGTGMALEVNEVLAARRNPPQPVFELALANGRRVRASANHPFLVLRDNQTRWLALDQIRQGDRIASSGRLADGTRFRVDEQVPEGVVTFVPLASVSPAGTASTYDIEVAGSANFLANGIFAHNSRLTMKYPSIYLRGEGATAEVISVAVAGAGQHQDTGAKAIHLAPNTRSRIISKSISRDGGRTTYRGSLKVAPGATGVVASVRCDALLLDEGSRSDTYPYIDIAEDDTTMTHEATVGKISADQIFYLMSRGLTENEATNLVVQGFLEVFTKELPMEYAIEFNRLVRLEMTGSLG